MRRRASKFGNKVTIYDGLRFHSKKEAKDYQDLILQEKAGLIKDIRRQVPFEIWAHDEKICVYRSDFCYLDKEKNKEVIHETKGYWTAVAKLKWKLLKAQYKDKYIYRIS